MALNRNSQLKLRFFPFIPILSSFCTNASIPQLEKVFRFPIPFKFRILGGHFNPAPTLSDPILTVLLIVHIKFYIFCVLNYRDIILCTIDRECVFWGAGRRCDQKASVMSH